MKSGATKRPYKGQKKVFLCVYDDFTELRITANPILILKMILEMTFELIHAQAETDVIRHSSSPSVWPVKNRQMSIKVAQ